MNKLSRFLVVFTLIALLAGAFAFAAPKAKAADGTFNISVYHGINGKDLGLPKELPVIATVTKDGVVLARIPLEFKQRFTADLPAGTYLITVEAPGVGPLPSMTVGPINIPADVDVRLNAQLLPGDTPIIKARVK
jgi:hypothetical protein